MEGLVLDFSLRDLWGCPREVPSGPVPIWAEALGGWGAISLKVELPVVFPGRGQFPAECCLWGWW